MSIGIQAGDLVFVKEAGAFGRAQKLVATTRREVVACGPDGKESCWWMKTETAPHVGYEFVPGEPVHIVSTRAHVMFFSDNTYMPDMDQYLGKTATYAGRHNVTLPGVSKGLHFLNTRFGGGSFSYMLWPEEALIPLNPSVAVREEAEDVDSLLEALYDCYGGKGGNMSELLGKYRRLTGKDRPGFMG